MFDIHQKTIQQFGNHSPENMAKVLTFVLCTIQQSLHSVPAQMIDIDYYGKDSQYLWGFKQDAYKNLMQNKDAIYNDISNINLLPIAPNDKQDQLLHYFANLSGFGLAKGGFCIQLLFGLSGCIDSHNVKRFGFNEQSFKAARFKGAKTYKTKNRLVKLYHDCVDKAGGCAKLWNEWCEYVADQQPNTYESSFEVSAIHCEALGLKTY